MVRAVRKLSKTKIVAEGRIGHVLYGSLAKEDSRGRTKRFCAVEKLSILKTAT